MEQHGEEIKDKKLLKLAFLNCELGPAGHPWNIGLPVSAQRLHTRDIKVDVLALLGHRLPTDSVCYDLVKIKALIG